MPLVTRQYGPNAKNLKLSFYDMDMNLYYLQELTVSGFSYSNNVFTLTNPTGGTKTVNFNQVTGLTVNGNLTVTGNTSLQSLTSTTISATTYQNLPIDPNTYLTGGTYSAGTATFTNNTGGTFTVSGFYTGGTPSVNYTIYKVLLTYQLGNFTITQLENTIGDGSNTSPNDIQWSNPSNGVLRATKTGAFSGTKVLIDVPSLNASAVPYICTGTQSTNNFITIDIFKYDGTKLSTPYFSNLPVEIRIYN